MSSPRKPMDRERLMAARSRNSAMVEVPEFGLGETIRVRGMTTGEYRDFLHLSQQEDVNDVDKGMSAMLMMFRGCVIDEDGNRVFQEDDDVSEFEFAVLDRCCNQIMALSNISTEEVQEAKARAKQSKPKASPTTGALATA